MKTPDASTQKDAQGQMELKSELEKTTIFLETIVASVFKKLCPDSPQIAYLQGHIELNRAALAKAEGRQ